VGANAWHDAGLARLARVMDRHVEEGGAEGLAWLVARHGEVHAGAAGVLEHGGTAPVARDSIFRVSSMTKPVTAVAALTLVEECRIRLDDPVAPWLPELAEPRVLADPAGPLDATVPAERPITVRDLLTSTMGTGWDFATAGPQPVMAAVAEAGLGGGPPAPAGPPAPDEWMRRLGAIPLAHQPGARWLYHTSVDVLGVMVARAAGRPLDQVLAERIFEPLGMAATGFSVPPADLARFGACHQRDPDSGAVSVYDPPAGQWADPPAFPAGGAGLVSTVDDWFAFAAMLRAGGTWRGRRILSPSTVRAMTANQLTPRQLAAGGPDPAGTQGWGFGLGVWLARTGITHAAGTFGWDGGLGSAWANDPVEDVIGVLLTTRAWTSPDEPPVVRDFWTATYAAIGD
jgi:CubicO group peptidase (beta-lactamase class C family)